MRILFFLTALFIINFCQAQVKKEKFFDIHSNSVSHEQFKKQINYKENIDVYSENDTLKIGRIIKRKIYGKLNDKDFSELKSFLKESKSINEEITKTIVLNYLSEFPSEKYKQKSGWNVLKKAHLETLNSILTVHQLWINHPNNKTLKYYHYPKIPWKADSEKIVEKLLFPYKVLYGNFAIIKPDGQYIVFYGEHGEETIYELLKESMHL